MKSLSPLLSAILVLFVLASDTQAQDSPEGAIRIDRNHSTLGFAVPVAGGISKVTGKFTDFAVDLVWDDENPSASSVFRRNPSSERVYRI